ncbi:Actin cytoskeleton-regulatory complex protein sla1 [Schizosaccharomyces pombe]
MANLPIIGIYKVLYSYEPQEINPGEEIPENEREISIVEDEIVCLLEKGEDDWYLVKRNVNSNDDDEEIGIVPSNYITEAEPSTKMKALYDYTQQSVDEISFQADQTLDCYGDTDSDWILVGFNNNFGLAPRNYVEGIDASSAPASQEPSASGVNAPTVSAPNSMVSPPPSFQPPSAAAPATSLPSDYNPPPPPPPPPAVEDQAADANEPDDYYSSGRAVSPEIPPTYTPKQADPLPAPPPPPPPTLPPQSTNTSQLPMPSRNVNNLGSQVNIPPPPATPSQPPRPPTNASTRSTGTSSSMAHSYDSPPSPSSPSDAYGDPNQHLKLRTDSHDDSRAYDSSSSMGNPAYEKWEVREVVGKKKKRTGILAINNKSIVLTFTKTMDAAQVWPVTDLVNYSSERKHVFIEFNSDSGITSLHLHASSNTNADNIIRALGDVAGSARAAGLREIAAASGSPMPKLPSDSALHRLNAASDAAGVNGGRTGDYEMSTVYGDRSARAEDHKPKDSSAGQKMGTVLYDFIAEAADELTVKANMRVVIVNDTASSDWWKCSVDGKEGVVPSNFIKPDTEGDAKSPPSSSKSGQGSSLSRRASKHESKHKRDSKHEARPESKHESHRESKSAEKDKKDKKEDSKRSRSHSVSKPDSSKLRTWTDRTGAFKVEAEFLGYSDDKIHLHKTNGVKISVPSAKMSYKDLDYVELMTGKKVYSRTERKKDTQKQSHDHGHSHSKSHDREKEKEKKKDREHRKHRETEEEDEGPPPQPARPESTRPALAPPSSSHSNDKYDVIQERPKISYDWFDFFLRCGVDFTVCNRYTHNFNNEHLDEACIPSLNPDTLRTLGLKEGDIIRVMNHVNELNGVSTKPASAITPETKSTVNQIMSGGEALAAPVAVPAPIPAPVAEPAPPAAPAKEVVEKAPSPPATRPKSTTPQKFDDDAWANKPVTEPPVRASSVTVEPARVTESMNKMNISEEAKKPEAPSRPRTAPIPEPEEQKKAPVEKKDAEKSVQAPIPAQPTGNITIQNAYFTAPQPMAADPFQSPLYVQPTGFQPPPSALPIQPTGYMQPIPVQATGYQPLMVQPTGLQPHMTGVMPQVTGVVPQMTGVMPQMTGVQVQKTGAMPQQPVNYGYQVAGMQPQATGIISQPTGIRAQATGIMTQPTGLHTQATGMMQPTGMQPQVTGIMPQSMPMQPQMTGVQVQKTGMVAQPMLSQYTGYQQNYTPTAMPAADGYGMQPSMNDTQAYYNMNAQTPVNYGFAGGQDTSFGYEQQQMYSPMQQQQQQYYGTEMQPDMGYQQPMMSNYYDPMQMQQQTPYGYNQTGMEGYSEYGYAQPAGNMANPMSYDPVSNASLYMPSDYNQQTQPANYYDSSFGGAQGANEAGKKASIYQATPDNPFGF